MKKLLFCISLFFLLHESFAQTIIQRDEEIEQMVKEISSDSLKSYINKLVTFGTRNTLSTTTDKNKGIGAAREWVVQRFTEFGKAQQPSLTDYADGIDTMEFLISLHKKETFNRTRK
jgi:hypothetical protein